MTFTDYADSYKMFFFAKDYVEFGKYCKPGLYLLIKGSIQNRFGSDQLEFKVSRIDLLQEVRKNLVKSITLMMPLNALTSEFISDFEDMTAKNKGSVILKFNIRDTETNISLQMFSRTTRIDINNEVINFFEGHEHIAFKIN